jgi:preprotein translocase subunit YajC
MDQLAGLLPLLLIVVFFWFLILRPARNRQREVMNVQSAIAPGVQVMTSAGLFATVRSIEDDSVVLEIAPGVEVRYAKQAVVRIIEPKPAAAPAAEPDTDGQA